MPMLEGIVEGAVLLKSGKILDTPGYDAYSGLFYEPRGIAKFLPRPGASDGTRSQECTELVP